MRIFFLALFLGAMGGIFYLVKNPDQKEQLWVKAQSLLGQAQVVKPEASSGNKNNEAEDKTRVIRADALSVDEVQSNALNVDGVKYVLTANEYNENFCYAQGIRMPKDLESFDPKVAALPEVAEYNPLWLGECAEGLPSGAGIAAWYKREEGQELYSLIQYLKIDDEVYDMDRAVFVVDGPSIRASTIPLTRCYVGYTAVLFIDSRLDKADYYPLISFSNAAVKYNLPRCPNAYGDQPIRVHFIDETHKNAKITLQNVRDFSFAEVVYYESDDYSVPSGYRNEISRDRYLESKNSAASEISKIRDTRRANRLELFLNKTNSNHGPRINEFLANPYAFDGQRITYHTSFRRMLGRDEALFSGPMLFTNAPQVAFTSPGTEAIVAGKVIGTANLDGRQIPKLQYISAILCNEKNCDELGDP